MAAWDSADLFARLVGKLRLPLKDDGVTLDTTEITAARLYVILSDAESDVYEDLVPRMPGTLIGAPRKLIAVDSTNKTFTITDGTTTPYYAAGHFRVYPDLVSIPTAPLVEGVDYSLEGSILRIPNDRAWTYPDGPYVQMVTHPTGIVSGGTGSTLPQFALPLLILSACSKFDEEAGMRDWTRWDQRYTQELAQICLTYGAPASPSNRTGLVGMTRIRRTALFGH